MNIKLYVIRIYKTQTGFQNLYGYIPIEELKIRSGAYKYICYTNAQNLAKGEYFEADSGLELLQKIKDSNYLNASDRKKTVRFINSIPNIKKVIW